MTPPVVDPLHLSVETSPLAPSEGLPPPPAATAVVSAPVPATPAAEGPAPAPSQASTYNPEGFLGRFHLVLGGGYNAGTRINGESEPFNSAAPSYQGGSLYVQPSYRLLSRGLFDLRLGAGLGAHFLRIPRSAGSVSSSFTALSLGGLVEGNLNFHQHLGLGLNLGLGYMGLISSDADIGAPFTASFDWGQEGNIYVGAQLFLQTLNQGVRAGLALDAMPTGFGLPSAPSQPDLLISYGPTFTLFAGVDPFRIVDFVQRGSSAPVAR